MRNRDMQIGADHIDGTAFGYGQRNGLRLDCQLVREKQAGRRTPEDELPATFLARELMRALRFVPG